MRERKRRKVMLTDDYMCVEMRTDKCKRVKPDRGWDEYKKKRCDRRTTQGEMEECTRKNITVIQKVSWIDILHTHDPQKRTI